MLYMRRSKETGTLSIPPCTSETVGSKRFLCQLIGSESQDQCRCQGAQWAPSSTCANGLPCGKVWVRPPTRFKASRIVTLQPAAATLDTRNPTHLKSETHPTAFCPMSHTKEKNIFNTSTNKIQPLSTGDASTTPSMLCINDTHPPSRHRGVARRLRLPGQKCQNPQWAHGPPG